MEEKEYDFYFRGYAKLNEKNYSGAEEDFLRAVKKHKSHISSFFCLGFTQIHLGKWSEAIDTFSRVIEMCQQKDPTHLDYVKAFYNRGYARAHQPKPKHAQAVSDFSKAIEIESDYAKAFYSRGKSRVVMGQDQLALDDFKNVLKYDEENSKYYVKAQNEIRDFRVKR